MRIQIKNVGQIEDAAVDLDGITVIAGENNTGKSTIGKTVFALLREMDEWKEIYFFMCAENIKKVLENRSQLLEEFCLNHTDARRRRTNRATQLMNEYCCDGDFIISIEDHQIVGDHKVYDWLNEYCKGYVALYRKNDIEDLISRYRSYFNDWIEDAVQELDQIELEETTLQAEFIKMSFSSCFRGQYMKQGKEYSRILFENEERKAILKLTDTDSQLSAPVRFESGVYFVESPKTFDEIGLNGIAPEALKMLMIPNTLNADARKRSMVRYSGFDFNRLNLYKTPKEAEDILVMLRKEMNGQADVFGKEGIKFKENGSKGAFYPQNVSTGVKALALFEYVVRMGVIKKKDILIFDEPEINLHPQWQIVYARALVLLQKAYQLTLIITTHSPYFLRAIECFTDKYESMEQLNVYYVSKDEENNHSIQNMMKHEYGMTELYEILSDAFDDLQEEIDGQYGVDDEQ